MAKVEILTGAERQRRWSAEQKLSILKEAFGTDGSVSVVARRQDILPQQIYNLAKEVLAAQVGSSEERIVYPVFGYHAVRDIGCRLSIIRRDLGKRRKIPSFEQEGEG
ncbi:transposase [Sinorhizobium medicae]|uniref:transposase n=1 Tax=Sinorhizobium medicae TaxID=110321 RepID=UPI000FDB3170|nr:transposase [Sinorhizobium medicae]RVP45209.1 hypothetical protein CN078_30830 [Sinorhizobium medicae]RVP68949.1 hypothetical protein CN079_30650 [Sinorhizobium medicae]UWU12349.1 transposase [Sinorhizobium medicae]